MRDESNSIETVVCSVWQRSVLAPCDIQRRVYNACEDRWSFEIVSRMRVIIDCWSSDQYTSSIDHLSTPARFIPGMFGSVCVSRGFGS